jgi:hypothetical protein
MCYPRGHEKKCPLGHIGADVRGTCSYWLTGSHMGVQAGFAARQERSHAERTRQNCSSEAGTFKRPCLLSQESPHGEWMPGRSAVEKPSTTFFAFRHIMRARGNSKAVSPRSFFKPVPPSCRLWAGSHSENTRVRTNLVFHTCRRSSVLFMR